MKIKFALLTSSLVMALGAGIAQAATIAWSVATITNDPTQVVNTGTTVVAASGSDGGATANVVDNTIVATVNGVAFTDAFTLDSPSHFDTLNARVNVVSGAYYDALRFADRQGSGTATWTFNGLTLGNQYTFQVWYSDDVGTAGNNALVLGSSTFASSPVTPVFGGVGTVSLLAELTPEGNNTAGQFATGSFIADSTTQILIGRAYTNLPTTPTTTVNVTINAFQLRDLGAIPEPSAALLGGLGFLALLRRRR